MVSSMRATVVIAKRPVAGRVKTRLCPPLSADEAATVAEAALADTLDEVRRVDGRHIVALDGPPCDADREAPWLPDGFERIDQGTGTLNDRLDHICRVVGGPLVIIAMDTPQVTAEEIDAAHAALDGDDDVVFGPTDDGGYWLVGCRQVVPGLFDDVRMSMPCTLDDQRRQADRLGLRVATVATLRDVDTFDDCLVVAALVPTRRFGLAVARWRS
jgi:uncharacterized protein